MKLPNSFGSVTKRTDGNRRKPYIVRKTIIGSYATYAEAIAFLVEYNKNPYIYSPNQITFAALYHLMATERYPKLAASTQNNYRAAFKHCSELSDKPFVQLRISEGCIRAVSNKGIGYATQKKVR